MPKRFIILGFAIGFFTLTTLFSQENKGCISEKMLVDLQKSFQNTTSDKAILNAIANNDINKLALNLSNSDLNDTYFSHKVKTKGITNQKSSGR
ncbi:MAG TPA: C1 family peptidase, partial [Bacteroidales bacterium]|nr:C1 family peptidase [Bacteroidales bacterium]